MDSSLILLSRCGLILATAFAMGALFGGRWKVPALAVAVWCLGFAAHFRFATESLASFSSWELLVPGIMAGFALAGLTGWKYRREGLATGILVGCCVLALSPTIGPLVAPMLPSDPWAYQYVQKLEEDRAAMVAYLAFAPVVVFLLAWTRSLSGARPSVSLLSAVAAPPAILLSAGFPGIEPATILVIASLLACAYALSVREDGTRAVSFGLLLLCLALAGRP